MLDLQERPAARPEDPGDLGDRALRPRDERQRATARDDEVDGLVAAGERLDVALRRAARPAHRSRATRRRPGARSTPSVS